MSVQIHHTWAAITILLQHDTATAVQRRLRCPVVPAKNTSCLCVTAVTALITESNDLHEVGEAVADDAATFVLLAD